MQHKLVFEKSVTRDWGIIHAQIHHAMFTTEFKKQFGWSYTDGILEGGDNVVSAYRDQSEHIDGMRTFILSNLDEDGRWVEKQADTVEKLVLRLTGFTGEFQKRPFSDYSPRELATALEFLFNSFVELGPGFLIMLWFPIQMEGHPRESEFQGQINAAVKARKKIESIGSIADAFARNIAREAAERAGVPEGLSRFMTVEEVLGYLKDGTPFSEKTLSERKKHFIITNDGILNLPLGQYLSEKGFELKAREAGGLDEVKGQAAFPGLAKGEAKIVLSKEAFGKVKEGDVIITPMTTPDYALVIKKSAAIVTDEGGITCHAAIVSRELQIPCVVGTKIATKVFKDGDWVEVDATNGKVRKVRKLP